MSEATHTSLPWIVRTLENFGFNVVHYINGDKFDLARVAKCSEEANAAFIARACNSHYELLNALKDAVGALEFSREFHSDLGNEEQAFAQDKLDAALNAIAKAEGRS